MIIGVLKEIKVAENRVCMTPAGVEVLREHGHEVLVETQAGAFSGFSDADYVNAGAAIVATAEEVYLSAEMVLSLIHI